MLREKKIHCFPKLETCNYSISDLVCQLSVSPISTVKLNPTYFYSKMTLAAGTFLKNSSGNIDV